MLYGGPERTAGDYTVHKLSKEHARSAAWTRTTCGSPASKPPADIITQWGAQVTPDNAHQEYPRPQMTRDQATTMVNANGLWEFQLGNGHTGPNKEGIFDDAVPFGTTLNQTILVPFPLEACLSGAFAWPLYSKFLWYRLLFDAPFPAVADGATLLHFGAVDWNTTVYLNGAMVGNHLGGYDGFSFDVTSFLKPTSNELILAVFDPSDDGYQVNGKQRISAINGPGGDTYTPTSGIWQTVWMESVPRALHISSLKIRGSMTHLHLTVNTEPTNVPGAVNGTISFGGAPVATFSGDTFTEIWVEVPNPQLWHPTTPNLYDLQITVTEPSTGNSDSVGSYFGMREVSLVNFTSPPTPPSGARVGWDNSGGDLPGMPVTLASADYNLCWALCNQTAACVAWSYGVPNCGGDGAAPVCWLKGATEAWSQNQCRVAGDNGQPGGPALRPAINGNFTFLSGFLDQSWWPDGEYAAPSDDALKFDLQIVKTLGMNVIRLHQKVNPQRWYWWADSLGVVILHDMVQKYGGATAQTVQPFLAEFKALIDNNYNHPSIIQYTAFNEGDCYGVFNVPEVVQWVQAYDTSRLVDTNSGGGANDLHIGNVNDIHSYPYPGSPAPSATQYAMVGEFGGIGTYVTGQHELANGQCGTYLYEPTPQNYTDTYVGMIKSLTGFRDAPGVSVCIYTQTTDVENECDGMVNMDRTPKFNAAQIAQIVAANQALTGGQ